MNVSDHTVTLIDDLTETRQCCCAFCDMNEDLNSDQTLQQLSDNMSGLRDVNH